MHCYSALRRLKDDTVLLKHKLYTSLIVATLLPLCISTIFFSNSLHELTSNKLADQELPTALSNVRNAIEWQLSEPIATSRGIATNLFVKQWLRDGESTGSKEQYIDYLNNVKLTDDAISAFIVSGTSQHYYSYSGEVRQLSYPSDNWFTDFLSSNKRYGLVFDINKQTGKAKVYVNYVIEIDGERRGLAGISHSVSSMNEIIRSQSIGNGGIVFLVDAVGEIKLHPDQSIIGESIPLNDIIYGLQTTIERDDQTLVSSSIPLQSLDWHLVAEIPEDKLYGPIDEAIRNNLLFGGLIAVIGVMLIILLVNRMFRPIEQITNSVSSLATKIVGKH